MTTQPVTKPTKAVQRLATYQVTLLCPAEASEEQLERLCAALEELDFRSRLQHWLEWYCVNCRVLRAVEVVVEE